LLLPLIRSCWRPAPQAHGPTPGLGRVQHRPLLGDVHNAGQGELARSLTHGLHERAPVRRVQLARHLRRGRVGGSTATGIGDAPAACWAPAAWHTQPPCSPAWPHLAGSAAGARLAAAPEEGEDARLDLGGARRRWRCIWSRWRCNIRCRLCPLFVARASAVALALHPSQLHCSAESAAGSDLTQLSRRADRPPEAPGVPAECGGLRHVRGTPSSRCVAWVAPRMHCEFCLHAGLPAQPPADAWVPTGDGRHASRSSPMRPTTAAAAGPGWWLPAAAGSLAPGARMRPGRSAPRRTSATSAGTTARRWR
jgi:hypothetical protein